jgi:hypothetical protein
MKFTTDQVSGSDYLLVDESVQRLVEATPGHGERCTPCQLGWQGWVQDGKARA